MEREHARDMCEMGAGGAAGAAGNGMVAAYAPQSPSPSPSLSLLDGGESGSQRGIEMRDSISRGGGSRGGSAGGDLGEHGVGGGMGGQERVCVRVFELCLRAKSAGKEGAEGRQERGERVSFGNWEGGRGRQTGRGSDLVVALHRSVGLTCVERGAGNPVDACKCACSSPHASKRASKRARERKTERR